MAEQEWDLVIRPKKNLLDIDLKAIWQYRDLIATFVQRDFTSRYKQTILGPIWFIVQPLLTTLIYTVVFNRVAKIPTDGLPPILFYMSGTVAWTYFSSCLNNTSNSLGGNSGIFGKVYFPRLTVPLSVIISTFIHFLIQFSLLVGFMVYYHFKGQHYHINVHILILPYLILLMAIIGLGFGLIVSSLTTKYRDLSNLVGFGMQLWMYATPIIYPMSHIPDKYKYLVMLNPMSSIIETFRFTLLGSGYSNFSTLLYSTIWAVGLIIVGIIMFNRVEKSFIDTV